MRTSSQLRTAWELPWCSAACGISGIERTGRGKAGSVGVSPAGLPHEANAKVAGETPTLQNPFEGLCYRSNHSNPGEISKLNNCDVRREPRKRAAHPTIWVGSYRVCVSVPRANPRWPKAFR